MGIIAIQYQTASDSPLLAAFNREERVGRQCQAPRIQSGRPRVVCGIDRNTGGLGWGGKGHSEGILKGTRVFP